GSLLEVNREQAETVPVPLGLRRAARKTQDLEKLPAVLLTVTVVGEQWISKVEFRQIHGRVPRIGKQRRHGPGPLGFLSFFVKQWADCFSPLPGIQCQVEAL